jgi:hypothetical protein
VQLLELGNQRRINGAYRVSQKHVTNDIRIHTFEINNPVNCKTTIIGNILQLLIAIRYLQGVQKLHKKAIENFVKKSLEQQTEKGNSNSSLLTKP